MTIKIATWNVNSARLRMPQIVRFLQQYSPDILCIQEIKCTNEQFPCKALEGSGYDHIAINGQKAYHGVAVISRLPIAEQKLEIFGGRDEARHLAVRIGSSANGESRGHGGFELHNFYVPAGGDEPDPETNPKFRHKLDFLRDMKDYFSSPDQRERRMVLTGDLNVAPLEHDVWSHRQLLKVVSHTPIEVSHLEEVISSLGWIDAMREHVPNDQKLYTWWSYRARDWRASNRGRRLDHIWISPALAGAAKSMVVADEVRGWQRPSDHAPVIIDLDV